MGLLRGMLGLALGAGDESSGSSSSGGRRRIVRCYCRICGRAVGKGTGATPGGNKSLEGDWIKSVQCEPSGCGINNHIPVIVYE